MPISSFSEFKNMSGIFHKNHRFHTTSGDVTMRGFDDCQPVGIKRKKYIQFRPRYPSALCALAQMMNGVVITG